MMTFDEIKDLINNVKFDENGKATNLQYLAAHENQWCASNAGINSIMRFIFENGHIYRIMPEPEYVPYTKDDWREFLGQTFERKNKKNGILVFDCDEKRVFANAELIPYSQLLNDYTKLDGSPAGKLKVAE